MKNNALHIVYLDFDDIKNPLLAAGQATATLGAASQLVKRGHTVTVLSSKYPGYQDRYENGIYYKHIGLGSSNIKLNNLVYIFIIQFFVRKIQADVIIECFTAPVSTLLSPLFTKIPVIGLPSMFNAEEFSRKYHLPLYLVERYGAKCYKYFTPYSDIDTAKMLKLNPNITYKVIPQGVEKTYFAIPHKKPEHILFLGRFDIAQKGIDLLLKSYAKVANKIGYPLVLAGHGPDEEKIKRHIKKLKLEKKVKLVGGAYGKKKEELISKAIFVAFPSRHDELSLWALEALASGMPLVTFDLPEGRWAPNTVALKAKPFDISAYGKLLMKAAEPEINKTMRIAARTFAKKFTWEKVAKDFETFMFSILKKEKIYEKN